MASNKGGKLAGLTLCLFLHLFVHKNTITRFFMTQSISDFPPYDKLLHVLEYNPNAGATYLKTFSAKSDDQLKVVKKDIRSEYHTSYAKFRNSLYWLMHEGILVVIETDRYLKIKFLPEQKQ